MLNLVQTDDCPPFRPEISREIQVQPDMPQPGALAFLLRPDPEAIIQVELVDQPCDLPQEQFEALLFESECEV